jgi:CheY-like chemotaxis protein
MKSGFLAIGKRGPRRSIRVVASIYAAINALVAVKRNPDGFDIAATDQVMPQMLGIGPLQRLRALRRDPPAVEVHAQPLGGPRPASSRA